MKNKHLALVLSFIAVVAAFGFTGCKKNLVVTPDGNVEAVVFTISDSVTELSEKTSVCDYLLALQNGEIQIVIKEGSYGACVVSVNGVAEYVAEDRLSGGSWMVYTDLTTLDGVTYSNAEYGTYEYGEITLNSASYGISGLPAVEGYTFALVFSEWAY